MNPPVVFGVRNCGNRALRTALGLEQFFHPDNPLVPTVLERHAVIVPLRDPIAVAVSWHRRANWPHPKFIPERFGLLVRYLERAAHHVVCVDRPELREQQLEDVAGVYGLKRAELGPVPERAPRLSLDEFRRLVSYVAPCYAIPLVARYYSL
ncbi:MAG TPA: hypothetical protein VFJ25_04650 [Casimicrobiaceae bacterium]|nr:hypothetical protein [Casimicrobiaceae bacterium]